MAVMGFLKNGNDVSWTWEKKKQHIENNMAELTVGDGVKLGKITNEGFKALQNNSIDGYTPFNETEKKTIEAYKSYAAKEAVRSVAPYDIRPALPQVKSAVGDVIKFSSNIKSEREEDERRASKYASEFGFKELQAMQNDEEAKAGYIKTNISNGLSRFIAGIDDEEKAKNEIAEHERNARVLQRARVLKGEIENEQKTNYYNALTSKVDFEDNSKYNPKGFRSFNEKYYLVNISSVGQTEDEKNFGVLQRGDKKYSFMTPEEVKIYNYLYNTNDTDEEANEYLNHIDRELNKRVANEESEQTKKYTKENSTGAVIGNIISSPLSIGGMVETAKQNIVNEFTGRADEVDINAPAFGVTRFQRDTASTLTEGKGVISSLLIETGLSIGQMAAALPFGSVGSLSILSSNAASSAAYDATKRGASAGEALGVGVTAGLIEALTEKIGIERWFRIAKMPPTTWKKAISTIAKQAGVEGVEELISEVLNNIADSAIMDEKSNYNALVKQYVDEGYSSAEAKNKAFVQLYLQNPAKAFVGGALSGFALGGAGVLLGNTANRIAPSTEPNAQSISSDKNMPLPNIDIKTPPSTEIVKNGPVKTADVNSAIERIVNGTATNKDIDLFKPANVQNRVMFEEATGVKLPSTNSEVRHYLRDYAKNQAVGTENVKTDNLTMPDVESVPNAQNNVDMYNVNSAPTLEVQDAQIYNIATSNLIRRARENNLDLQTFYAETENVDAYNLTEQDIQTINNAFAKLFGNNVDDNIQGNLNILSKIANKYPVNVISPQQTEVTAEGQNITLNNPLHNGIMFENGGVKNGNDKGGEVFENDKRFNEVPTGRGQDSIQSSTNKDGIIRTRENGIVGIGYGKAERRTIETIVDTPEFQRVAKYVGNELSEKSSNSLLELYKDDPRIDEGYDFSEIIVYDMLADESNELRKLFSDSIDEYFNTNKSSADIDSTGAKVSDEVLKKTANSVVRNSNGQLIPLYHGTDSNYSVLLPGDIGIHFGSYAQASELVRRKEISSPTFIKAYLNITNPLIIERDSNGWNAAQITKILENKGIIDHDTARILFEKGISQKENKRLVQMLQTKGYDGIVYNNEYEAGSGKAYIVFDDSQIIRIENNSNIDGDTKFDHSSNKERWTTERINKPSKSGQSIGNIVDYIRDTFDIPISTGKVENKNARGVYKVREEAIRTRISNNLPTISHELGHHLDKKYHLSSLQSINDLIASCDQEFLEMYKPEEQGAEAVAEFVREYLKNVNMAKDMSPDFYGDFLNEIDAEDLKNLNVVANYVNTYMSSDFSERVQASIVTSKEDSKTSLTEKFEKFYRDWVDSFFPQKQVMDYVKKTKGVEEVEGDKDAYVLATNSLNAATIANHVVTKGMTDLKGNTNIGKSLLDSIKNVKSKNIKEFEEYLVLNHALEWLQPKKGEAKRVFADDTLQDISNINKRIAEIETIYPEFVEAAENLYEYQRNIMKNFVVDAGGMSLSEFNRLNEMYPKYVPFYRSLKNSKAGKTKASFANQNIPIKRAKGSGLDIISPLESIIKNTEKMVKFAQRNQVMKVWSEYADTVDGFGKFMEKVPPDMLPHAIDIAKQKGKIFEFLQGNMNTDDYITVTDAIDDILGDTVTGFSPIANANKKIVSVLKNGEKTYYQIHDDAFYESIANMTPKQTEGLLALSAKIMTPMKLLVTQNNPIFVATNALKDIGGAYRNSDINNPAEFAKRYISALYGIAMGSQDYISYQAMGGGHSSELSASLDNIKKTLNQVAMKDAGKAQKLLNSVVLHPIQFVASLNDAVESVPRFMEFKRTLDNGGDTQRAIYKADDITTNFKRGGLKAKQANDVFMYFNAAVQGLDKMQRSFTDVPKKEMRNRIVKYSLTALLMTAIQQAFNYDDEEEYNRLSSYMKNNFYNFSIGNGNFIKLPKPRELAMFDSFTERCVELTFGNKDAFKGFGQYLIDTIVVPGIPTDFSSIKNAFHSSVGDTVLSSIVDIGFNRDFKGSPIETRADEYLPRQDRYNEKTSEVAFRLANSWIGQKTDLSPKQIDHIIDGYGILGQLNRALLPHNKSSRDWTLGVKSKFVADSYYSTDTMNNVYDARDRAEDKYLFDTSPENAIEYEKNALAASFATNMNKAIKGLPKAEQRDGRKVMVESLEDWDYEQGNLKRILPFVGDEVNDELLVTELPSSEFSFSKKGKKYTYTFTPEEYVDYVEDYIEAIEKVRANTKYYGNYEEYIDAMKKEKSKAAKSINSVYRQMIENKAIFKE